VRATYGTFEELAGVLGVSAEVAALRAGFLETP